MSNIPFLSKLIEKAAAKQIYDHMAANNLHETMQSAYKPLHSTETALLRIHNDILTALNSSKPTGVFLALIDLSAAFDTVDHMIFLEFLEKYLGIKDKVLNWLKTYMCGRMQQISIEAVVSELIELLFGVPQGSVLGPFLFCMYLLPIGAILRYHGIDFHTYADDTQLYLKFDVHDPLPAFAKLCAAIKDIRSWMIHNKLKINDDKTEFVIISSPKMAHHIKDIHLEVGDCRIEPSLTAMNLGIKFDSAMNMKSQVSNICRSVSCHLRNIGSIRRCLDDTSTAKLVHALITSRLDYCNSLLYGIADNQLNRLQRQQNNAAHIVSRKKKHEHISDTMKALHWLKIEERILFKIMLMVFKARNGLAPSYISELISSYEPARTLRSSSKNLLQEYKTENQYGDRAFQNAAPREWNKLESEIRCISDISCFKKSLKTLLFRSSYPE